MIPSDQSRNADLDNLNSDENVHLDDEDPPIVQERTPARRRHSAAGRVAGQFIAIVRNAGAATRRPRSHTTATGGASWPELTTTRLSPTVTPRPTFAGSTSSSNANAPPAAAIRTSSIQNDGARQLGAATFTQQPAEPQRIFGRKNPISNARRPRVDGGLFYFGSDNNHFIGGSCPLECRDHRGTTTPWLRDRERTELNHRATTKCSRLSIQALDIVA